MLLEYVCLRDKSFSPRKCSQAGVQNCTPQLLTNFVGPASRRTSCAGHDAEFDAIKSTSSRLGRGAAKGVSDFTRGLREGMQPGPSDRK
jgi:hypothetical protein